MPKKISTKCNVFLQLTILRPHPHFTRHRHVRKKIRKTIRILHVWKSAGLQIHKSAFYRRPRTLTCLYILFLHFYCWYLCIPPAFRVSLQIVNYKSMSDRWSLKWNNIWLYFYNAVCWSIYIKSDTTIWFSQLILRSEYITVNRQFLMFLFPLYYYAVFALLARNLLPVSYKGLNVSQFNNIWLFLTIFYVCL